MVSKLKIIGKYLGCAILTVIVAFISVGVPLMVVSATDLEIPIATGADDCGGWSLGADTWTNNAQYNSIGKWTTKTRGSVAYRFQLNIPAGATIDTAYFSGVIQTTGTGVANIFVEDDDNAEQIISGADQAARVRSALSVEWTLTGLSLNTRYSSPSLVTLIQYLVNLGTWTSGNYCNIIIEDSDNDFTSWVNFYMSEAAEAYRPKLYVTYTGETTTTTTTTTTTVTEGVGEASVPNEVKWEYLDTGNDSDLEIYDDIWAAQTFTVGSESHSITKVRLLIYREGSPSTITVGIRETSSGLPVGDDIASGTINGDALTATSTGAWYSIVLSSENLDEGVVYAIVVRATLGDVDNSLHILFDSSSAYTDGTLYTSANSGTSWTEDTDADALFEVYGTTLVQILSAKVFSGYVQDGDWLIALEYINEYTPYYGMVTPNDVFSVRLYDTDSTTVIASRDMNEWGYKPFGLYISAAKAASLTWQSEYYVKIVGNTSAGIDVVKYYKLTISDWKGSELKLLDNYLISIAYKMEHYFNDTFIGYNIHGLVLNDRIAYTFYNNIKGITKVRPKLFASKIDAPDFVTGTTPIVDAYADISYMEELGTQFGSVADTWGTVLGIDGKTAIGIGFMIIYLIVAIILSVNGSFMWALGLSAPALAVAAWFGVIPIMIPIAIASIFAVIIAYKVWIQGAG